jgi:predicted  nucleic acid-binding Zn-ribbon protein
MAIKRTKEQVEDQLNSARQQLDKNRRLMEMKHPLHPEYTLYRRDFVYYKERVAELEAEMNNL